MGIARAPKRVRPRWKAQPALINGSRIVAAKKTDPRRRPEPETDPDARVKA
jgi:hypothetical protein